MAKRIWSPVCPYCGRAYKRKVWDFILGSRPRGVLAIGQPVPSPGNPRYGKADTSASSGAELDAAVGAGFFSKFKARLLKAVSNWLGNGWLSRADLKDLLSSMFEVKGGYAMATFGPGYAEGRPRADAVRFAWGSVADISKPVARCDIQSKVWG